jgi:hypothetical protein
VQCTSFYSLNLGLNVGIVQALLPPSSLCEPEKMSQSHGLKYHNDNFFFVCGSAD